MKLIYPNSDKTVDVPFPVLKDIFVRLWEDIIRKVEACPDAVITDPVNDINEWEARPINQWKFHFLWTEFDKLDIQYRELLVKGNCLLCEFYRRSKGNHVCGACPLQTCGMDSDFNWVRIGPKEQALASARKILEAVKSLPDDVIPGCTGIKEKRMKVSKKDKELIIKMWTGIKKLLVESELPGIKNYIVLYKMNFCKENGVHWIMDNPLCDKVKTDWSLFYHKCPGCPLFRRYGKLYKTCCNDPKSWFSKAMKL